MILIDLPMPEACDVCPMNYDFGWCKAIDIDNPHFDEWGSEGFDYTTRSEYCPLKEQEATTFKPHYIDEYGKNFICGVECGSCHKEISSTYHYCPYCGRSVKWE